MIALAARGPLLAIDTAFERCSAGLYDTTTDRMLASAELVIGKGHAEQLMGIVGDVLAEAGMRYGDLAKLAVTVGPGSFTGLRVGVSAVRGLALALGIPAVGVSTLEAMAAPFVRDLGRADAVLAVLDAKRGEVYAALYGPDGKERVAPTAIAPEDLLSLLEWPRNTSRDSRERDNREPDNPKIVFGQTGQLALVGSGAQLVLEHLLAQASLVDRLTILSTEARVDIAALAKLAIERQAEGSPVPLYLRGADAKPAAPAAGLRFARASLSQAVRV